MTLLKTNNIKISTHNRLSVQVSLNGLSFLVTDPQSSEVIFFHEKILDYSTTPEELLIEIESIFFDNAILNSEFQEVSLIYATSIYSLVPKTLFDETKASEYLKFNAKILANDYMAHDVLENQDIVVVYIPFMNINNFFFEKYGSFNYYHATTLLLKSIFKDEKYTLPKMFLHFQKNTFDCIVLKDGALQLCNSYSYKTPEDFIYYTLFCMEQLQLNPETLPVYLCGAIDKADENYKMAYTFIRNIEFATNKSTITKLTPGDKDHQHFILKTTV
ncbi:DUF3822 family protein [Aequorivita marina]|uniref:DUF3822 family protein n=1 Tax=Aequorivita marina TaxID=3073654 RepID=UPI0028763A10|nr:DUF3822 family protein [Aequorivita sp. S2608]MDS1297828.1 DUF3822 family protein [Aequorivita sp. S2608]